MKIALQLGEDYPHLFISAQPGEIAWCERASGYGVGDVVVDITEEEWALYCNARDAYFTQVDAFEEKRLAEVAKKKFAE